MPEHPRNASATRASALLTAAESLFTILKQGAALTAHHLRDAMHSAFGGTDADGRWSWHDAYEASEAAVILFLRRYAPAMRAKAQSPAAMIAMLERLAALEPSHTRRSEEQIARQQFSTPLSLAYAAIRAARLRRSDVVLEPSAGTGMLAVFAHAAGVSVHLNELAETRRELLRRLFPECAPTAHNAEHIGDVLHALHPSVVLMNPPFSRAAHVETRKRHIDLTHVVAAYSALRDGGRLVAITGHGTAPGTEAWDHAFRRARPAPRVAFTATVGGRLYARRGTTFTTRLTVLDRTAEPQPESCARDLHADSAATLIDAVETHVPRRSATAPQPVDLFSAPERPAAPRPRVRRPVTPKPPASAFGTIVDLDYTAIDPADHDAAHPVSTGPFDPWTPRCIRIADAKPHPTSLVQSAAMASIRSPIPAWRPMLPSAVIDTGILSVAQLETIVLAGEAHAHHLATPHEIEEDWEQITPVDSDAAEHAVRFRRGFMIGDGTGTGKGREVAGVILDHWLRRDVRRHAWFSISAKLVEDARRDWSALGGDPSQIIELAKIRQGDPIPFDSGILFVTYATLRSPARGEKPSRLHQIVEWLAGSLETRARASFEGCIVFDEAHAFAHAAATRGARGLIAPSQQGIAGMRLQHALPDARILYVSATGASTLDGLAYAERLGLWGANDAAFATRSDFITSMTAGGVAAMEVVSRDLVSLGRYTSRLLSYHGVEVDILEHPLSDAQRAIYDAYAEAFIVIHRNIEDALEAAGVTNDGTTLNPQAKSAARSAFESCKQRFFGHLLTSMKCPSLMRSIRDDLAEGRAAVVQLISTGEALLERRIAEIPASEWDDLSVDLTPREYVLSYLEHAFPVHLYESYTDENGHEGARLVTDDDGRPVLCQDAIAARDALIEKLAALPPVPSALDQILHEFGHEHVAEITGRSRRVVRIDDRLALRTRPASANLTEAAAFQADAKRVLVFSLAGGTGRSYHADLDAVNQRKRVHYLLEPGWRADTAIQGLGRTHRTHQAQPPLFRPVTTDVKGERRFIATIAKRLDALGALTRGQRDAQGGGMFRPEDNLESAYAHAALRQLYRSIHRGHVDEWSLETLESLTGLRLTDREGYLKEQLPPMSQFLNRLLALPIDRQNSLFTELETRIEAVIEDARSAGSYNIGLETLVAESFTVLSRETVHTDSETGARTELVELRRRDPLAPMTADEALIKLARSRPTPSTFRAINTRSGHAAVIVAAPVRILDDGGLAERCRIIHPVRTETIDRSGLSDTYWAPADEPTWRAAWEAEIASLPSHTETTLWLVTGLLLPIWHLLPDHKMRIRRLTTDDGERLLGRVLSHAEAAVFRRTCGLGSTTLSAEEVKSALLELGTSFPLVNGWRLTRRKIMGLDRIEIEGPAGDDVPRLKHMGCVTEIISWRTRVFVPLGDIDVLATVLERCPIDPGHLDAA